MYRTQHFRGLSDSHSYASCRSSRKSEGAVLTKNNRTAIVISGSSDIGYAISQRWIASGWEVFCTYRTSSPAVDELRRLGAQFVFCDLRESRSILSACSELRTICSQWDVLVLCPGTQDPVGPFSQCDFDSWEESVTVNFTGQMRVVHQLLHSRQVEGSHRPLVLFFAGVGTNNAPPNYSAYVVSKIALIKMCELLDAEIQDSRFVILGPGWIRTKIHGSTIRAGEIAGDSYQRTLQHFDSNDFNPMDQLLDCCDWLVSAHRDEVGGRNFSLEFDLWGTDELGNLLREDSDMYKLRRHRNDDPGKKEL